MEGAARGMKSSQVSNGALSDTLKLTLTAGTPTRTTVAIGIALYHFRASSVGFSYEIPDQSGQEGWMEGLFLNSPNINHGRLEMSMLKN